MSETIVMDTNSEKESSSWFSWNKYSDSTIRTAEKKILQYSQCEYKGWFVDIDSSDRIWTVSMNTESQRTPLVLLHGFAAGVALWCMNLESLSSSRPVYAMDILGFGRSSRPKFSNDALEAEQQLVKSIEEWRKEMKLDKFILLGHSMGGFLATSYAIIHPERVQYLILADPWGISEIPDESQRKQFPMWAKVIACIVRPLNPLWAVRVAGPYGQWVINKVRPDITRKYSHFIKEEDLIAQYLYQCNAQSPSGESAFHAMMSGFIWAKHPMVNRIGKLDKSVPITILYGSNSWVDKSAGEIIREMRSESVVQLEVIPEAGHHVYADHPDVFNKLVNKSCNQADGLPTTFCVKAAECPLDKSEVGT